jgi:hypothetical protein
VRLQPLPVPTRLFGGEDLDSYARRAARRNHTDTASIQSALREWGLITSTSLSSPARLEAWR